MNPTTPNPTAARIRDAPAGVKTIPSPKRNRVAPYAATSPTSITIPPIVGVPTFS